MAGIRDTLKIDVVTEARDGEFALIIVDDEGWNVQDEGLVEALEDKINTYLSFALDGQLQKTFPDSMGRRVRIQIDTEAPLDPDSYATLRGLAAETTKLGIRLTLRVGGILTEVDPA